jgi:hypothetical protein
LFVALQLAGSHVVVGEVKPVATVRIQIAPRTQHGLADIAIIRLCLPDSMMPAARHMDLGPHDGAAMASSFC